MKTHQLTLVMRNRIEIHELVAATKKILIEEKTAYIHQDGSKADHEKKREDREEKNSQIKDSKKVGKKNQEVSESPLNEVTSRQKDWQDYSEETPKLGIDEAQAIAGCLAEMGNGVNKTVTKFTYDQRMKLDIKSVLKNCIISVRRKKRVSKSSILDSYI